MKKWRIIFISAGLLLSLIIIFITKEAILETDNWKFLDLDYSGKSEVISSYGTLLAALLSSFSIILLVFTILSQAKEANNQEVRFNKAHKLQKKQFEAEKKREERKYKLDLYFKLKLISVFLESIIIHIEETGVELRKFYLEESANPLNKNSLYFLVNKNMNKLIEIDYLSIFVAFKEFSSDKYDWTKKFNNLFNIVGFYKDAVDELQINYKYHVKDKYTRKSKITEELKSVMSLGGNILGKYKEKYNDTYLKQPFSSLVNEFIKKYHEIIKTDIKMKRETDLDLLSQGLLLEFLKKAMGIKNIFSFDDFGSRELVTLISSIRKDVFKLKFDCGYFADDCKKRYNEYLSPESVHLKELKSLKLYLDSLLIKVNLDTL